MHVVLDKIPVMLKEKVLFLNTNDIVFIRSFGSSTIITDSMENEYQTNLRISELEQKLKNKGFLDLIKAIL